MNAGVDSLYICWEKRYFINSNLQTIKSILTKSLNIFAIKDYSCHKKKPKLLPLALQYDFENYLLLTFSS